MPTRQQRTVIGEEPAVYPIRWTYRTRPAAAPGGHPGPGRRPLTQPGQHGWVLSPDSHCSGGMGAEVVVWTAAPRMGRTRRWPDPLPRLDLAADTDTDGDAGPLAGPAAGGVG